MTEHKKESVKRFFRPFKDNKTWLSKKIMLKSVVCKGCTHVCQQEDKFHDTCAVYNINVMVLEMLFLWISPDCEKVR